MTTTYVQTSKWTVIGVNLSESHTSELCGQFFRYRSLMKEYPCAEHFTSLPRRGVSALSSVSTFNQERVPMFAYSDSLPKFVEILHKQCNIIINYNVQWSSGPWKLTSWLQPTLWTKRCIVSECNPISQLFSPATSPKQPHILKKGQMKITSSHWWTTYPNNRMIPT